MRRNGKIEERREKGGRIGRIGRRKMIREKEREKGEKERRKKERVEEKEKANGGSLTENISQNSRLKFKSGLCMIGREIGV